MVSVYLIFMYVRFQFLSEFDRDTYKYQEDVCKIGHFNTKIFCEYNKIVVVLRLSFIFICFPNTPQINIIKFCCQTFIKCFISF